MEPSEFECVEGLEQRVEDKGWKLSEFERWMIRYLAGRDHEAKERLRRHEQWQMEIDTKLERFDAALFDPDRGLVYVRAWLCRIVTWAAVIGGALLTGVVSAIELASRLHFIK